MFVSRWENPEYVRRRGLTAPRGHKFYCILLGEEESFVTGAAYNAMENVATSTTSARVC